MKKYKIVLIIAIIFISLGFSLHFYSKKSIGSVLDEDKINDEDMSVILVDKSYRCKSSNNLINNVELGYKLETYYHFDVINNNVENGQLEKKYIFYNKNFYDNFTYNSSSFSIESHDNSFNENELSKSYFYFLQYDGSINDVFKYLEELKEKGYVCE